MRINEARQKGGAPQLGARVDGDAGPFGVRGVEDQEEPEGYSPVSTPGGDQSFSRSRENVPGGGQADLDVEAAVNNRVARLVAQARARRDRQKAQRRALQDARQHGLAARHASKLRRLEQQDGQLPDDAA